MIKLIQQRNGNLALNINNKLINLVFSDDKIWLRKKEIANLFGIKKSQIKEILNLMAEKSQKNFLNNSKKIFNISKGEFKNYYSIDIIISIGYRLNNFNTTKLTIKINRTLKNLGINRKSIFSRIVDKIDNFNLESYFSKKYNLNL